MRRLLLGWLGIVSSFSVHAETMQVLDEDGNPLKEAVLFQLSSHAELSSGATRTHVMDQINRQFAPQLLFIQVGDSVNFPNSDNVRHHVYSFSAANTFELRLYEAGDSPDVPFPEQGIVVVGCNIHDQMRGHIVVGASELNSISDEAGTLSYQVEWKDTGGWYLWHPWMSEQGKQPMKVDLSSWSETNNEIRLPVTAPVEREESELEKRFQRRVILGGD
ncbi:MAG: hypothetical protein HLUCCO02_01900 [Idiomarinaceae bacterium HL-53]|nr:MAG: hypothetical protein HLUCCO02_01900 [Idiomarinaceae bacterium HL-53]CUS48772.1 hypothetical protein Ga0003345_1752 [Idiomarinaceae bacterium HL-53]